MKTLEIDEAEVLQQMQTFNTEDSERASDAGESRQRIGTFLEKTGLNAKAFSFVRMVLRMKKDDKRQDCLRSLRALMPILEREIAKIGTQDAFDVPAGAKDLAADEPSADDKDSAADTATGDDKGEAPWPDDQQVAAAVVAAGAKVKKFAPRKAAVQ